jgi:beta-1,2-mannobiose phosphorylase / 1,2-beta-oligomannan phosphorylase
VNYKLERLGVVMERDGSDPREAWGVLNPASARGPDGELYLFPRLVAQGNYSRIGRARVVFADGRPTGVERLGLALEPEESWESKGVEDPRVTLLAALGLWVMAYTAYGPAGPRVAVATSADLVRWERLGLATFDGELDGFDNKDATYFPEAVPTPGGGTAHALLHRPANEERPASGSRSPRIPAGSPGSPHTGAANVVFPTAIDGSDVYYGMADARIGAARLSL